MGCGAGAGQVRWFSFQFVLAQLADELSDMHNAMGRLLVRFPQTAEDPSASASAHSQRRSYEPLVHSESFLEEYSTAEEGRGPSRHSARPPSPLQPLVPQQSGRHS